MNRDILNNSLKGYCSGYGPENEFVIQFLELLQHPDAFQRDHLPGHITGSAWIVDSSRQFVLLVHHGTLNKWLQPGGHADGEENVLNVARREANEETGLKHFELLRKEIFDLDIHPIPGRSRFPSHLHYDIRFLFEADRREKITVSEESHDVAWIAIDKLGRLTQYNPSVMRMAEKLARLNR